MKKLAQSGDRFNTGNYAIAEIVNAALVVMNLVKEEYILTAKKVSRARDSLRRNSNVTSQQRHAGTVVGLYIDGRKDRKTFYRDKKGTSCSAGYHDEEHVVLVQQPGSEYLTHLVPSQWRTPCEVALLITWQED